MIPFIIKQWDKNKHLLESYFKTRTQEQYNSYKKIVQAIFKFVITENNDGDAYNYENILEIDDGDYQGTKIFIIHPNTYQPQVTDYLVTHTYYGSCSGCDTLQAISYNYDEVPTEEELKQYMTLALHLVQKIKYLYIENGN